MTVNSPVVEIFLGLITIIASIGTWISSRNMTALNEIRAYLAQLNGRTRVLEDWRKSHETWQATQISEIKAAILKIGESN